MEIRHLFLNILLSYSETAMGFTLKLLEAMELLGYREKIYPPAAQQNPNGPGPPHDRGFTITLRRTSVRLST